MYKVHSGFFNEFWIITCTSSLPTGLRERTQSLDNVDESIIGNDFNNSNSHTHFHFRDCVQSNVKPSSPLFAIRFNWELPLTERLLISSILHHSVNMDVLLLPFMLRLHAFTFLP